MCVLPVRILLTILFDTTILYDNHAWWFVLCLNYSWVLFTVIILFCLDWKTISCNFQLIFQVVILFDAVIIYVYQIFCHCSLCILQNTLQICLQKCVYVGEFLFINFIYIMLFCLEHLLENDDNYVISYFVPFFYL